MVNGATIADLVRAAEPAAPRPLGGLLVRLAAAGLIRGALVAGSPAGADSLAGAEVSGLAFDSRRVAPGGLFVAIPGEHADGHAFVGAAAAAGARAAVVERPVPAAPLDQVVVADTRRALATCAAWWYGDPSRDLRVVGVTGTDGKTTTSFLAAGALERAGLPTGLVGTVATRVGGRGEANPEHVTTPEAPELQAVLRAMVAAGDRAAVVETTSHGLALHRVDEIAYDVAVLTNVTHEHLELHGTFEAYRAAKLSLFTRLGDGCAAKPGPRAGIVNHDDPSAPLFEAATRAAGARLLTYGTTDGCDVRAVAVSEGAGGLAIDVAGRTRTGRLELRLAGRFNVHNALAVVALGDALDLDPELVREGLATVDVVPGRMERIEAGQPFTVVVDYAHTPASLATVLDGLAPLAAAAGGGLVAVFGSAGERDVAKRTLQGRVAGERCRLVVATDEDPRGEDRLAILEAIAEGAEAAGRRRGEDLLLVPDRRAAIAEAFARARPGDVVLLAGKGHERSIIYATGDLPWDERAVALELLAALGWRARG